ncbi:hypothetical protein WN51_12521 [Melipona quadrifasciata]|uniref:Uncharacterized protein n=1 Tax=Melipona quadrifasciata TaxID=166423 RepID=A0A0N0BHC1_9HYME|nr:hypothetical protein WN51_12521 [Melipona quadrifasciata]
MFSVANQNVGKLLELRIFAKELHGSLEVKKEILVAMIISSKRKQLRKLLSVENIKLENQQLVVQNIVVRNERLLESHVQNIDSSHVNTSRKSFELAYNNDDRSICSFRKRTQMLQEITSVKTNLYRNNALVEIIIFLSVFRCDFFRWNVITRRLKNNGEDNIEDMQKIADNNATQTLSALHKIAEYRQLIVITPTVQKQKKYSPLHHQTKSRHATARANIWSFEPDALSVWLLPGVTLLAITTIQALFGSVTPVTGRPRIHHAMQ